MSDKNLKERYGLWAVIAGGSEGIGSTLAERLAAQGINLALIARKPEPLEKLATDIRNRFGVEVRTLSQDLTTDDAAERVARLTDDCDVGIFIRNAGSDTLFGTVTERELAQHEFIVRLNAITPMRLAYHFGKEMQQRKRGAIVLCSSMASLGGMPGNGVYSAAKAFMNTLCEVMWYELGKHGIDVCSIVIPGVKTPAMYRMGARFDENSSEPSEIADEILANLKNGPIVDAGYCKVVAPSLRTQPRRDVVLALGAASEKYVGS